MAAEAVSCPSAGISPMGWSGVPAIDPRKEDVAYECGKLVMELVRKGITPRSVVTRKGFENAVAGVMATGGSTNAVLHLPATAREVLAEPGLVARPIDDPAFVRPIALIKKRGRTLPPVTEKFVTAMLNRIGHAA